MKLIIRLETTKKSMTFKNYYSIWDAIRVTYTFILSYEWDAI